MNYTFQAISSKERGFTIVELIVVISVIAVLAAIVISNVSSFSNKGKDAAAKGNLAALVTASTKYYYENNSNFNNFFNSGVNLDWAKVSNALAASNMNYSTTNRTCDEVTNCNGGTGSTQWCIRITLKQYSPTTYYCVDSSGNKKQNTTTTCANGACT